MGVPNMAQGKNVIITFILHNIPNNFHTDHYLLQLHLGKFGLVEKRREKAESPLWSIVLANPTFPKTPLISVCLICAFQKIFYVKKGNYLEFVWRCRFWRPTRPWRENHDFPILNIAKLAIPLFLPDYGTLDNSVMTRYLDDHEQCRPRMLGVDAHLYRLLSSQI